MKKNLAARYQAIDGQQVRERATGSCISPHKQNIKHVMGEVEERSGLVVPEHRTVTGSSTHAQVVEQVVGFLSFTAAVVAPGRRGCKALRR
jgi:hypothetical protein